MLWRRWTCCYDRAHTLSGRSSKMFSKNYNRNWDLSLNGNKLGVDIGRRGYTDSDRRTRLCKGVEIGRVSAIRRAEGSPEWLNCRKSGHGSQNKSLWIWLPLISLSIYLDSLYISEPQPWLQLELPGRFYNTSPQINYIRNSGGGTQASMVSKIPQMFPLHS